MNENVEQTGVWWGNRAIRGVSVTYGGAGAGVSKKNATGKEHMRLWGGSRRERGAIRLQQGGKRWTLVMKLCMLSA